MASAFFLVVDPGDYKLRSENNVPLGIEKKFSGLFSLFINHRQTDFGSVALPFLVPVKITAVKDILTVLPLLTLAYYFSENAQKCMFLIVHRKQ